MKRKLLFFVFSLIFLFISTLSFTTRPAQAKNLTCKDAGGGSFDAEFKYSNESPNTSTAKITLIINSGDALANSSDDNGITYYLRLGLTDKDDNQRLEYAEPMEAKISISNGKSEEITIYDKNKTPDPDPALNTGDWFFVELRNNTGFNEPLCRDAELKVGGNGGGGTDDEDCSGEIVYGDNLNLTPAHANITFSFPGLKGDDNERRGFVLREQRTGRDLNNSCVSIADLKKGINLSASTGYSFLISSYEISIFHGIFDAPLFGCTVDSDSKKICNTPEKFDINPAGGFAYFDCTKAAAEKAAGGKFEDWDQSKRLKFCSVKTGESPKRSGKAPYCIQDPYSPTPKGVCSDTPGVGIACPDDKCDTAIGSFSYNPPDFAKSVLTLFLSLAGGIVLLFLIINGYKLMTSSGDPEKVKEARESIISAITGLLFIIFSLVILQFLTVDILQLPGFNP